MAKYSDEFKLKVVTEYIESGLGYKLLSRKYRISCHSSVLRWVSAYKKFGEEGLFRKHSKQLYTVKFKLDVLNFMKQKCISYQEAALAFNMNNPSLICNWYKIFLEEGVKGLLPKPKGRAPMTKKSKQIPKKKQEDLSDLELLKRENELLSLENSYLKKLRAFQENPNAYLEKHRPRWHSTSKKKDSN